MESTETDRIFGNLPAKKRKIRKRPLTLGANLVASVPRQRKGSGRTSTGFKRKCFSNHFFQKNRLTKTGDALRCTARFGKGSDSKANG